MNTINIINIWIVYALQNALEQNLESHVKSIFDSYKYQPFKIRLFTLYGLLCIRKYNDIQPNSQTFHWIINNSSDMMQCWTGRHLFWLIGGKVVVIYEHVI